MTAALRIPKAWRKTAASLALFTVLDPHQQTVILHSMWRFVPRRRRRSFWLRVARPFVPHGFSV